MFTSVRSPSDFLAYLSDSHVCIVQLRVIFATFAFSALTLLVGRQEGHPACKETERWGAGVFICLEQGADLHMAQRISPPLTVSCFSKIQIGLPFWYRPTQVVLDKGPLNVCVCVCVHCGRPSGVQKTIVDALFYISC